MHASESKLSKELKNGIGILVGQAAFYVMDQNSQNNVLIKTQEPLDLLKFNVIFWVPWKVYYKMHISFFKKVLIILR